MIGLGQITGSNMMNRFTPPAPLNTAVLFLVFNRLDTTKQVFAAIKQAKPPRLYISADGARTSKEGEAEKVNAVRGFILQNIDWDCEIKTLFREENLGCKYAVSGAIDWFFKQEESGIILEDDCLPSQSFFWFCEELLERYKDDRRVWHISGDNFQDKKKHNVYEYYFSKIPHIWGWATWSNRWGAYDVEMKSFKSPHGKTAVTNFFVEKKQAKYWLRLLGNGYKGEVDTWDFQWAYTCFINNGLSINPNRNMVTNIGFGIEATHTKSENKRVSNLKNFDIEFPIDKVNNVSPSLEADVYSMKKIFYKNIMIRVINKISRFILNKDIV